MYDIYVTYMDYEECLPDKQEVIAIPPQATIHFVLSGEGYINGINITENTVFIASENTLMHYYPSKSDPWKYIYLRLVGEDLKKAFLDHGLKHGISVLPFSRSETLSHILSLYRDLSVTATPEADKMIANAVFMLFDKPKESSATKSKPWQHAEQIAQYIEQNYFKKITVEAISSVFYLNKNYIRTVFIERYGISPKQYIQKMRMERAAFLLRSTDENIMLIAISVGYDDPLLFSKMFKRYFGVSPSGYRNENK